MVKKAYMKTIEMLIVIVVSAIFLIVIFSRQSNINQAEQGDFLIKLEKDETFRNFVRNSTGCYNSTPQNDATILVDKYLGSSMDYILCSGTKPATLPAQTVYVDSIAFAGNYTNTTFRTIRLYYWVVS